MNDTATTIIGSIGVSLLLIAFFLHLFRLLRSEGYPYLMLNVLGGALACYSSYLIRFAPFVILEGTWAAIAVIAVVRRFAGPGRG